MTNIDTPRYGHEDGRDPDAAGCLMHGEREMFVAPFVGYVKEPGCTCTLIPAWDEGKAAEKPVEADPSEFLVQPRGDGAYAFVVSHDVPGCMRELLVTQHVHVDTLVRIAAKHVCGMEG